MKPRRCQVKSETNCTCKSGTDDITSFPLAVRAMWFQHASVPACDAVSLGEVYPTFRRIAVPSSAEASGQVVQRYGVTLTLSTAPL